MKTADYINGLIAERENLKEICKSHAETIYSIRRELAKLNNALSKKDKKILKLENESINAKVQKELNETKSKLSKLEIEYNDLKNRYDSVVAENIEYKNIFYEIENICDSDGQ